MNQLFRFATAVTVLVATAGTACAQNPNALAGIDHIPLAVRDLQMASEDFRKLGFAIKPGRDHGASIRNRHIKFPDGSGLELITVGSASDELSVFYMEHLKEGDGPAYVSFHVRDAAKLASALSKAHIEVDQAAGLTTFKDPRLGFVFITLDNRSPTDRPEHFDHLNGAVAMSEVWIASDDPHPLKELLLALGATSRVSVVRVPEPTEGEVFELQNGRVVIVRARHQLLAGRPVFGVVMSTKLTKNEAHTDQHSQVSNPGSKRLISPSNAHGLWLEFRVER
ncbi:MAG: hypothetical protein CFE41_16535 [Burkholderiales bacterium PBB2]|nr:MAG: hypothetical protein CFE41_16535 [Burkholderiales bacterium PBB2]